MVHPVPPTRRRWLAGIGAALGGRLSASLPQPGPGGVATGHDVPVRQLDPGRWVWADLFTEDVSASERFYGAVFGWTFERTTALGGRYRLARAGDEQVAR